MSHSLQMPSTRRRTSASDNQVLERLSEIVGEAHLLVDPQRVEPYGQDAVKEKFPPEAVVFPRTTAEVSAILRLANEARFPVTARGGGVGYTGGAVPVDGGIVLGTDRMNEIVEISPDDLYVVTEPGVTTYALQQAVEQKGLFYPPDPSSYKDSFIGGNIAENAGGIRSVKYGVTKNYVLGLEVVMPQGDVIRTGGRTSKNVVGFDLNGLMCGSEGMLGIITEATLRLLPLPEATGTIRAAFKTMREACACIPKFTAQRVTPVAVEVLDRNSINAVEAAFAFGLSAETSALMLVSVDGTSEETSRTLSVIEKVLTNGGAFDLVRARTRFEEDRLWDVRRALSPAIKRYGSLKLNEDVVVPRSRVPDLIERVEEIGKRLNTFVVNFGHAGDGNIHVNFMCDRDDAEAVSRARAAVKETFAVAVELGGTISGEHGIGYVKAPYLHMALDPATINTMKMIKRTLDPNNILNPGKMFS